MLHSGEMKLVLPLFFIYFSTASAAWQDYVPTTLSLPAARAWVLERSPPEVQLFFFEHLPRVFPVSFLCQLSEGADHRAVPPNVEVRTEADGAILRCPETFELKLNKNSVLSLTEEGGRPQLRIKSGNHELRPLAPGLSVDFGAQKIRITSFESGTVFQLHAKEAGSLFFCLNGLAEVELGALSSPTPKSLLIGTGGCQLQLPSEKQAKIYLYPAALVHALDLNVPVSMWPSLDRKGELGKFDMPTEPSATYALEGRLQISNNVLLNVLRSSRDPQACTLYTVPKRNGAAVKAYQFQIAAGGLPPPIKLHPDYQKHTLYLECQSASGIVRSPLFKKPAK